MKLQNFYYRLNVQDTDLNDLQSNVQTEIENILTDLKSNGIWNKPTLTRLTDDGGTLRIENLVSRINGKRQSVTLENYTDGATGLNDLIDPSNTVYVVFYIEYNQVDSVSRIDGNGIHIDYISEDSYTIGHYSSTVSMDSAKSSLTSSQVEIVSLTVPPAVTDITDGTITEDYSTVHYRDYPQTNKVLELNSNVSVTHTIETTDIHTHFFITVGGGTPPPEIGFTLNLPAVADNYGKVYTIMKVDDGIDRIEINPNASETINGKVNFHINLQYENLTIFCDGSEWKVLSIDNKMTSHEIDENYTISDTDGYDIINSDDSGGDNIISLPTPSASRGRILTLKKITGGNYKTVIDATASETIDGKQKYWLTEQYQYITVYCDGSEWFIKSHDDISSKVIYTDSSSVDFGTTFDGTIHWPYDTIEVYNSAGAGDITFTLPDIADIGNKKINIILKDNTTGTLTINPDSGDTINSLSNGWVITENNDFITIENDESTDWSIISKGIGTVVDYYNSGGTDAQTFTGEYYENSWHYVPSNAITLTAGVWEIHYKTSAYVRVGDKNSSNRIAIYTCLSDDLYSLTSVGVSNEIVKKSAMGSLWLDTNSGVVSTDWGLAYHGGNTFIHKFSSSTTLTLHLAGITAASGGSDFLYLTTNASHMKGTHISARRIS